MAARRCTRQNPAARAARGAGRRAFKEWRPEEPGTVAGLGPEGSGGGTVKSRPPIPAHRQHPFSPGVHRLKRKGQFTYQTTNPANQAGRSEVWEARDCDSTQEMS